ncbi:MULTISPECIES: hypothetical protein [Shewanella]|uniref:Uncharacterized protein n=1 Tax=Shewanella japonica TaxID=93973 RepID=A0ABM6JLT5_9GAMM|nr:MULTISPECIES: hypothetical protein [Shewanella]ARD22404.1 hypothetical protein SJ2017_2106 [Shewanella japonica]KPZ70683.1 hypothetical protein AN944_02119 [Shewanella sp. P1-14-1]
MKNKVVDGLLKKHEQLNHLEGVKVVSHTQRDKDEWVLHTLMIDGYDVAFTFKRPKKYKSLKDQFVSLTYYKEEKMLAGFSIEVMQVVRVKRF